MVEKVTGGKALPAEVLQQIVTKTDGVPLFVEELTKRVVESDCTRRDGHYELSGRPSTAGDSRDAARFADGAARSAWRRPERLPNSERRLGGSSPTNCSTRSRRLDEDDLTARAAAVGGSGAALSAWDAAAGALSLQACARFKTRPINPYSRARRQQYHQQIAQVLEEQFPRHKRNPTGVAGASLHRGRTDRAGHSLLAAGRGASHPALGLCGSDQLTSPKDWSCSRPCRILPSAPSKN